MPSTDGALSAFLSRLLIALTIAFANEFEHHMLHKTTLFGEAGSEPPVSSSALLTCESAQQRLDRPYLQQPIVLGT